MKFFDRTRANRKKKNSEITVNDLVLLTISLFPDNTTDGIKGEKNIHALLYNITELPEFNQYRNKLNFKTDPAIFSASVHSAIKENSLDVSNAYPEDVKSNTSTKSLFSDSLRFDDYAIVSENEKEFSKNILNYQPKRYVMTVLGSMAAVGIREGKLSEKQKKALDEII